MESVYTFGDFLQGMVGPAALILLIGGLSRFAARWALLNAVIAVGVAFVLFEGSPRFEFGFPGKYVIIGGVAFCFFERRDAQGLDALAPFKRWRQSRRGTRADVPPTP